MRKLLAILLFLSCALSLPLFMPRSALAAFTVGFDFRATSGFVTDPSNCFPELGSAYPSTYGTTTAGWTTLPGGAGNPADRNASNDARLAGIDYASPSDTHAFRVHLPATGSFTIIVAMGDATGGATNQYMTLADGVGGTVFDTLTNVVTGNNTFADSAGNVIAEASFFASQVSITHTFTNQDLVMTEGNASNAGFSSISFLQVTQNGGGGTKRLRGAVVSR